jgi:arylsulfatase A-like enzyme
MPNVDRLAQEGVVMDNAISTFPVCSPYRGMLLTGLHPMHNGVVTNDTALRADVPTVATAFRDAGYRTGYIGKWHLEWNRDPAVPPGRRGDFQDWAVRNCSHDYLDSFYCDEDGDRHDLPGYEPLAQTDLACEYIADHRDEPFCLFLSWGTPHDPYTDVPDRYLDQIDPADIDLPPNVTESEAVTWLLETDSSDLSDTQAQRRRYFRESVRDEEFLRNEWLRGYYAHTTALDDCLGRLLQTLDDHGLRRETIVVFASDHGDMLGSHRMASKQLPYEESIHVPFVVRYPEAIPQQTRSDALLSPIDVLPTLCSLADIEYPSVDGRDLAPALRGEDHDGRTAVPLMKMLPGGNPWMANGVTPWRGVRTKRYTYARLQDRGPWLLFDNVADPYQCENLIDDPAHADVVDRLESRLQELLAAADDPDDTSAIRDFRASRRPDPADHPGDAGG